MLAGSDLQRILEIGPVARRIEKIGQHERRRALLKNVGQAAQPFREVGPSALGAEPYQLLDDRQHMRASFFRRDELLDPVAEKDAPYLVVVLRG